MKKLLVLAVCTISFFLTPVIYARDTAPASQPVANKNMQIAGYGGGYGVRCRWVGGYWRNGYWHPPRKICRGARGRGRHCRWVGGNWKHGKWYPARKVCRGGRYY